MVPASSRRLAALTVTIVVFSVLAVGGMWTMSRTASETREIVTTLDYNARRGDCIRAVVADADQRFRRDVFDLIADGPPGSKKYKAIVERMRADVKVNYADTVKVQCRPAIEVGP